METDEVVKQKRIRHCYPRKEVYHRWIHSEEYIYSPKNGSQISGVGNYLRLSNCHYGKTEKDFEANWLFNEDYIVAIINRKRKFILLNRNYYEHCSNLERALPSDYKVFYTNEVIKDYNIINHLDELLQIHCKFIIKQIVNYNNYNYACLKGLSKYGSYTNESFTKPYYFQKLNKLNYEYSLSYKKWFNKCFDKNYIVQYKNKSFNIPLPSVKQILCLEMFTKEEKETLNFYNFYHLYCYGYGISSKWLKENIDKVPTRDEAIKFFRKTHYYFENDYIEKEQTCTYKELIIKIEKINYNIDKRQRKEFIRQSNLNYQEAIAKLNKLCNNVSNNINDWRKHKVFNSQKIYYKQFVPKYSKREIGTWIDRCVGEYKFSTFNNTQLRLSKDGNRIETSRNCTVFLKDGIRCFKLFNTYRRNKHNEYSFTFSDEYKVGIYNLRFIKYTEKITDKGESLNHKEWLIQIGCHALWLDDILDFIHYYKLEKDFGLEEQKK